MSLPLLKPCIKKRKTIQKQYNFDSFFDSGDPIKPNGPFRDNIRVFIQECSENIGYKIKNSMSVWCTLLVLEDNGVVVPLYTVEEIITLSHKNPFCDHCRCSGWSHHFVSKRKYHIIIPAETEWPKPLSTDALDLQTHLLHGLIHCNGFGHLLCVNGIEGGSKYLSGRKIMNLWDRICTSLHARKITVEDLSRKGSMDLRLLHGIAYGCSWFGKWGYEFYKGSFGVQKKNYQDALEFLSSMDLDELISDMKKTDQQKTVKQIISSYRDLSGAKLITLGDLLKFMLAKKSEYSRCKVETAPAFPVRKSAVTKNKSPSEKVKSIQCRKIESLVAHMDSRWPKRRLEYTAEVVAETLKENKASKGASYNGGMTRQDVRDAARLRIGDTGLLDYVLKSMNNVIVGNLVVRRRINPSTRVLEYTIRAVGEPSPVKTQKENKPCAGPVSAVPVKTLGTDVCKDIHTIYEEVLMDRPETDLVGLSVRVVLDSKQFIKEWPFEDRDDHLLRFICCVQPAMSGQSEMVLPWKFCAGEVISLPLHSTYGDLKVAAQRSLRDTYCIMENYTVSHITKLNYLGDEDVVFGAVESGSMIWVSGTGIDLESELAYEGGPENWTVECSCGARDDDGERMMACDICEVWQHTRCRGIQDSEAVPPIFVCNKCCSSLMPSKTETLLYFDDSTQETKTESLAYLDNSQETRTEDLSYLDDSQEMVMGLVREVEEPWMLFTSTVEEPWTMFSSEGEEPWMILQC